MEACTAASADAQGVGWVQGAGVHHTQAGWSPPVDTVESWWGLTVGVEERSRGRCWAGKGSAEVAEKKQMRSLGLGGWAVQLGVPTGGRHAVEPGGVPEGVPGEVPGGLPEGVPEGMPEGVPMSTPAVAVAAVVRGQQGGMGMVADCTPVSLHTLDFLHLENQTKLKHDCVSNI